MLTPTKEAIDAAMTYGREKLSLATLKPEQETAISIFALGKDKITGTRCFLNCCEESDDPLAHLTQVDPNNPSVNRLQYLVRGRRVWGFDQR